MADDEKGYPPVALPAGSFDVLELRKNLGQAVSVKDEAQHPERINKAIVDSASETTKEVLANAAKPPIPDGAEIVEQDVVYVEGADPVKTEGIVFKQAKDADGKVAASGEEASKMRYTPGPESKSTDEPPGAPPADDGDGTASLTEVAAEQLDEGEGGASKRK